MFPLGEGGQTEWCATFKEKGGKRWAAVVKLQATAAISPPPIFFPLVSYGGAHHSAANAVSERNLQRKITKTRQQLQQKELAKLKLKNRKEYVT